MKTKQIIYSNNLEIIEEMKITNEKEKLMISNILENFDEINFEE